MNLERLKTIHNGDKVHPTFSVQEMERRVTALRKEMAETGVDAVLFTSYHNINYYSDFLFTSFGRNYALVVTQDTNTTISANIDAGQPWRRWSTRPPSGNRRRKSCAWRATAAATSSSSAPTA